MLPGNTIHISILCTTRITVNVSFGALNLFMAPLYPLDESPINDELNEGKINSKFKPYSVIADMTD